MYEYQKNAMTTYYRETKLSGNGYADSAANAAFQKVRAAIYAEMDEYYAAHPNMPSVRLKSHIHTLMAKYCEPVIFPEHPFFFEIGMREANSWGLSGLTPACWIRERLGPQIREEHPIINELERRFANLYDVQNLGVLSSTATFDTDHHTLGYTELMKIGVNGLIEKSRKSRVQFAEDSDEYAYCLAAEESCLALIHVAEKFADRAEGKLACGCGGEKERKYLAMMAQAARRIPANPPETFYEGLCMLLFTREVIATMENVGISQIGHLDRLLGRLYEADLAAGRITEEEARELVGIWMLHTDIKFDLENTEWPETSTCVQLGGCDETGAAVYNMVTRMFIEEHHRLHLVSPKLNCRYCKGSPDEYLKLIGEAVLAGHNNFVLINDDIIISGLLESGVAIEDARLFVNGGCQETMIEGFGHTEGVACYVSIPRLLDLFLRGDERFDLYAPIESADTYEEFYTKFMDTLRYFINLFTDQRNTREQYLKKMLVSPLFSATQMGCIETGRDYTCGGAKYNFSTFSLVGLGTTADILYAVRALVYEKKLVTLAELREILAKNWEGHESLRQEAVALPKYGHNDPAADQLANEFLAELSRIICARKNERGGQYIPSLFAYYQFETLSKALRATPDGRHDWEIMSSGSGPSGIRPIRDLTTPLKSMQRMDFSVCRGGSAVLDVQLPATNHLTPDLFASFARACQQYSCPTLQPNVVSVEELQDAKVHPEQHKNLIVRICGLSAYFTALNPTVQDEIIARNLYAV